MQLRAQILKEHSRANMLSVLQWVGDSQSRFDQLFDLFLNGDPVVVQRAGWPMSYAVMAHPRLITKHFSKLLRNLDKKDLHNAVKRNTVRLLQDIEVPVRYRGQLMDRCFNYIMDPTEKAAIKAFSLTILQRMAKHYPEIRGELKTIIEDRWEHETAAVRSRAKKILKEL